jgi:hypothetical protein
MSDSERSMRETGEGLPAERVTFGCSADSGGASNPEPDASSADPREERLRLLCRAGYEPVKPSEALQRRVAEVAARPRMAAALHPVVPRLRLALSGGLAVLGLFVAIAFWSRTETAALTETLAAFEKIPSLHWTGVQVIRGKPQRWEFWYALGRSREVIGDTTTIDDGQQRRKHRAGAQVVFVDRSWIAHDPKRAERFQPGGFLRALQEMKHRGWLVHVQKRMEKTSEEHLVQRFDIDVAMDRRTHPSHDQRSRMVLLVDPNTKLPVSWTIQEFRSGNWQPSARVDRIEYNVPILDRTFQSPVPAGMRTIDVDQGKRSHARLAVQRSRDGREIILRGLDLTAEGDVMVSVSNARPGNFVGVDHTPPTPVEFTKLMDDRGAIYVDTWNDYVAPAYTMFWLMPLRPRNEGAPWPRRFTLTVELENRERVIFRAIPAPPPAFESVLEVPPFHDFLMNANDVEKIRTKARARWQRLRR